MLSGTSLELASISARTFVLCVRVCGNVHTVCIAFLALVFAFAFTSRRRGSSDLGRCSLLLCFSPVDLFRLMCNHTMKLSSFDKSKQLSS